MPGGIPGLGDVRGLLEVIEKVNAIISLGQSLEVTLGQVWEALHGEPPPDSMLADIHFGVGLIVQDLNGAVNGTLKEVLFARTAELINMVGALEGGGGGGADWDTVLGTQTFQNLPRTAGDYLAIVGRWAELQMWQGYVPWGANPQFAWLPLRQDTYINEAFAFIAEFDPLGRPASENVNVYLNRVDEFGDWFLLGRNMARDINLGNLGVTRIICLVTDEMRAAPADYSTILAAVADAKQTVRGDLTVIGTEQTAQGVDLDTLLLRTVDEVDANLAILAGLPEPVGETIEDIAARVRQYLPFAGEGTAGAAAALAPIGQEALPADCLGVIVEVTEPGRKHSTWNGDPDRYRGLGTIAFGTEGRFSNYMGIPFVAAYFPVPPGADAWTWELSGGGTGQRRFLTRE